MYAIIKTGGKQLKVKTGDIVEVEKLDVEVGGKVTFSEVLAVGEEGGKLNVGTPMLEGATVAAEVKDQFRAKKIVVFKMKRRKGYRRTQGHRQSLTRVEIGEIKRNSGKKGAMQYDANGALLTTEIPGVKLVNRGKVRDVYDLGDALLFVATDRISAFDVVMPCGVPRKGEVLTQISLFWFDLMRDIPNHLISADVTTRPELAAYVKDLQGRSMIVRKAKVMPVECIVRGYLVGSGWKDYQKSGTVSGLRLRDGYQQASKLDEPLFTPSTKAEIGAHDEAISFEEVSKLIGAGKAAALRDLSLKIYTTARDYAEKRGIIVADTKFEFGELDGKIILVDEVLTPDSSRFWPADQYKVGTSPVSLDKQYVRDYLETLDWNKTAPGPELPADVVKKTSEKYLEAYRMLTGRSL